MFLMALRRSWCIFSQTKNAYNCTQCISPKKKKIIHYFCHSSRPPKRFKTYLWLMHYFNMQARCRSAASLATYQTCSSLSLELITLAGENCDVMTIYLQLNMGLLICSLYFRILNMTTFNSYSFLAKETNHTLCKFL